MRLYAGVVRFFAVVVLIHVAMLLAVGALARASRGHAATSNTLRIATNAVQVRSLDPAQMSDSASTSICDQIYEGLVSYDQTTLEVVPGLAESWEVSPDGTLYTFHLRSGARFIDDPCFADGKGREFTAEDVRYSFTRICDPLAMSLGSWLVEDRVQGAAEYVERRQQLLDEHPEFWKLDIGELEADRVEGFEAVGDRTFRIHLVEPFAPFLKVLAMAYFRVTAPEAVRAYGAIGNPPGADTFFRHPVGTGPFMLAKWEPDVEIVLVRNPGYWERDTEGRPLPHIDGVHIVSRRDPHTAFMEFEEGRSDLTGVPDQDWDRVMNQDKTLKQPFAGRYTFQTTPRYQVTYHGFDMQNPPFGTNKKLRQALNLAVDRDAIIREVNRGVGTPAYGPIPPGLAGYDPSEHRWQYDLEHAKQLLAEAGYPGGEGLDEQVLYVSGTGEAPDREAVALMDQMAKIGIKIRLKMQPWTLHLESIDRHEARLFSLGWIADYPDAENFLALFHSRKFSPDGPNSTFYANPDFDALYDRAMTELDTAKREELYRQASAIIVDDCPWLFTTYAETIELDQPWVEDFPVNPLGLFFYKNVRIDRERTVPANP
jgi:oligopeptide transport system substrate-binding protein